MATWNRFANGSSISFKGLFSRFEDYGTTFNHDVAISQTGSTFGTVGDSAMSGTRGEGTGVLDPLIAIRGG